MSENPEIKAAELISEIVPKRGRDRPRKLNIRCRGRPKKPDVEMIENTETNVTEPTSNDLPNEDRGRPRLLDVEISENTKINAAEHISNILPKRGRGRPRLLDVEMSENTEINAAEQIPNILLPKRGRGRPRKSDVKISGNPKINATEQISNILFPPKRGRGRPRKSEIRTEIKPPLEHMLKKRAHPDRPRKDNLSPRRRNKMTTKTMTLKQLASKRKSRNQKIVKNCAVSTCLYSSTDPGRRRMFHLFPNDSRRSIWMYLAGITSVCDKRIYICDIHFKKEDCNPSGLLRLKAVPNMHLPSQEHLLLNKDIFNDLTINPSDITVKLHETIKKLTCFKKKHNDKYADFLLNFYLKHSSAYKLLEKPLGLFSILQLKKEMYNSPINFLRFSNLINKKLLTMDDKDKVCFVTCVQIAIEPKVIYSPKSDKLIGLSLWRTKPADSVNILIAHGVNSEWHIPLDIAFINIISYKQYTKHWIEQTYGTLHVTGFAWFPNYADYPNSAKLFATLETLKADLTNQGCHIFYDLYFLLKLLYFNMKSINYFFGEFNAKLDDLKELYALDSKRTYPLAPNLSANNINLSTFDQLTYKHIKEVFSDETAVALRTYTEAELIKAEGTAIFVENISLLIKLFDSNVKLTNEEKESIVCKVQEFLKTIKYDPINHFVESLSKIMDIYLEDPEFFSKISKYLLNNYVHRFVDTILNNSFGEKTTSMDIENAYRKGFVENLLKPIKKNVSFDEALDLAQKELSIDPFCLLKTNEHIKLQFKPSDYKLYMLEREDRILYVAGYILKKCLLYHNKCSIFKDYIDSYTEDDKLLSKSIQKEIDEGNCSMLKNEFVEFIEVLEIFFLGQFLRLATRDFFIKNLLKMGEMQAIRFTSACPCFPSSYARELFVRIRVDYVLTYNNMNDDGKFKTLQNISL